MGIGEEVMALAGSLISWLGPARTRDLEIAVEDKDKDFGKEMEVGGGIKPPRGV